VTLTASGIARKDLQLRIYRNDQPVLDVPVRKNGSSMQVRNIPLKNGSNAVSAVYVSPGGEGPRSNIVMLTVDDSVPRIELTAPRNHDIVDAATVTLIGVTDPAATVGVTNLTKAHTGAATADDQGRFTVAIALEPGGNDLEITSTDAAGNAGTLTITLTRGSGSRDAQLTLSNDIFRTRQLPATFDVSLLVIDANGLAVDGAPVTFSLSPPGVPTSTYSATTQAGRASWPGVSLSEGIIAGNGFVTARVTLADGSTLQRTASFVVK
jgi:hypothetical protein